VDAASAAVEIGVREPIRLEVVDQLAAAQLDADRAQPGVEQSAGVVGTDIGGNRPLAGGALADHPLGDLQHRGRIGRPIAGGRRIERQRSGRQRHCRVRPLGGTALLAAGGRLAATHAREKLFRRGGGRHLGVGAADVHAGVIVRATDPGAAVGLDVDHGGHIQLRGARAVAHLPDREELGEAAAMAPGQRRRDVVEGMRQGAGDPPLVKVRGAGLDIAGVCLQPLVVPGIDPVTKDVHRLGLAGEAGGQLLGDEAVGTVGQLEAAVDRVVVGDRDEGHPPSLGQRVDLLGRRRALRQTEGTLDAEPGELRGGGVAVHVYSGSHRCLPLYLIVQVTSRFAPEQGKGVKSR